MEQLRASALPRSGPVVHVWTLGSSSELGALRAALHQAVTGDPLTAGQLPDKAVQRMLLVATELATNGLKYARPPVEVCLFRAGDVFIIDVADSNVNSVPGLPDAQPLQAGGRGLRIVQAFSLDVGWYTTAATKHVWASFPASETTQGDRP